MEGSATRLPTRFRGHSWWSRDDIRGGVANPVTGTRRRSWRYTETRDKRELKGGMRREAAKARSRSFATNNNNNNNDNGYNRGPSARVDDNYNNNCNYVGGDEGPRAAGLIRILSVLGRA